MIRINDKYCINSDEKNNVILQRIRINQKTKEETLIPIGFYSSLDRALDGFVKDIILKEVGKCDIDISELKDFLISLMRNTVEEMKSIIKED